MKFNWRQRVQKFSADVLILYFISIFLKAQVLISVVLNVD
uniref:Uncharacterized protein n=1 Tax=Lepeophtheirus salmonis TaxID=72036 RepID=A0A0K2TMT3_LEPSM